MKTTKTYIEKLIKALGFKPKDGVVGIYYKQYASANNYVLELDFKNELYNYGELVSADSKTTQRLSQAENLVVFECVDRLLEKGYQPCNITLEKTWPTGKSTSGRLDIFVTHDDGRAFLMIECKTAGAEFTKEYKKTLKDGGQLFTYYRLDTGADFLMLYTSKLSGDSVVYQNQIIKIEDDCRQASNAKDFYELWNKLPKDNGIFDSWTTPYHFLSKALTTESLVAITQEDSSKIFNRFLEILRHNVVSDKPNAFNKIFTLFLCKIFDEKSTRSGEELRFQWLEGVDDNISFQKRLTDLYSKGMSEFLSKKVTDFSESDFDDEFGNDFDEVLRSKLLNEFTRIRLMKNNEFAIKEVFDYDSFQDNGKVVKEVVELLQGFRIRYTKKQQYLSDFFELLLTTGLKQESGQFFTPVPIAQFIVRSLPINNIISEKLEKGEANNLLPTVIDYAAGSGHFLTETMHVVQDIIDSKKDGDYLDSTAEKIRTWQSVHFEWADQYIYGIEKDYRLVKVGKVGCYLHGDGIANVVHSDGLGSFTDTTEYSGKLRLSNTKSRRRTKDNQQFDIVISNPPYSVSAFKNNARKYYDKNDFELYGALTDQSSEIECLFIERTKQLLIDGGVAGIVLPSTILSNGGIYTKTRALILSYFEIIGITELGSNTFMATNTNTVTLFLRRRKNRFIKDIEQSLKTFAEARQDITINGIKTPVTHYVANVWESVTFEDYITIFQKAPNDKIKRHEIYEGYYRAINATDDGKLITEIINREIEKLIYFIIAYPQKVLLIKSGNKKSEKAFLGYEFSSRRGSEGIHPTERGKTIDECTKLYDVEQFENKEKASTYIYDAFNGDFSREIDDGLKENISRVDLIDMMAFDRIDFDKSISLSFKKKIKIESKWEVVTIGDIAKTQYGYTDKANDNGKYRYLRITDLNDDGSIKTDNNAVFISPSKDDIVEQFLLKDNEIVIARSGSVGKSALYKTDSYEPMIFASYLIRLIANTSKILPQYLFLSTQTTSYWDQVEANSNAVAQPNLNAEKIKNFKIPLPPLDIQKRIVAEINKLEAKGNRSIENIRKQKSEIHELISNLKSDETTLGRVASFKNGLNYSRQSSGDLVTVVGVKNFKEKFSPELGELESVQIDGYFNPDYKLQPNDILVVRSNGSANLVGRFLFIREVIDEKTSFSGFTIRIRSSSSDIDTKFLCHYLRTNIVRERMTKDSKGSNIKSLNQSLLSSIKIPRLPLLEQQKIVKLIENIETKITRLEKDVSSISQQKQAVLEKYL